jgi:hypothetical protein
MEAIDENWDSFVRECQAVYKKAQGILTTTMLELETEIEDLSRCDPKGEALKKHAYWLRVLESCYEAFLWVAMHSDIDEIDKGPKYSRLSTQNIQSTPNFLQLCRDAGLKAGFFSKKHTNRLRSKQQ